MASTLLIKNVTTTDPLEFESLNYVKQEIDEMVNRNEPLLGESSPSEFYNAESKYIIDEIKVENGKVWPEEVFLTTGNFHSVKTETSEVFNMKHEEVMEDPHLIRNKNHHMENINNKCTMTKIEDVSKKRSMIQLELVHEKFNVQTSMDCIHSVKTEKSEDFNANEESKYILNQIIDENGKVWPEEGFLTSWNFRSVKMERSADFNGKTDCTKNKKKDSSEMLLPIQMAPSPTKCDLTSNLKSIHSKLGNHKYYSCHLCDFSSSWKATLHEHIKSVHIKPKNHKCYLCDYSSPLKGNLQRHIESVHLKLCSHECHLCDYSSSQEANLQVHIKSVHLNLKNHKCHLCDFSTSLKAALQRHIKSVHLKLRGHKCHICVYSSSQKAAVQRHIKSVHLKRETTEVTSKFHV